MAVCPKSEGPLEEDGTHVSEFSPCVLEISSICPACGQPIDYCQGHGLIGDPVGVVTLEMHDRGIHSRCHENSDCR